MSIISQAHHVIGCALVAGTLFLTPTASASKTVQIKLYNDTPDTPDTPMNCTVKRVLLNGSKSTLKTYVVKPKNQKPSADRGKSEYHNLRVSYIVKRLDRSVIYPKLELTCKLSTPNTQNSSPHWDDKTKAFTTHRLSGSCRSGAYCSLVIQSR